ncbi:MAG: methionyl-tRNA formyltransferase, partial [Fusobacteriaceae bacterium]|nr:methionyl-tRNA formyltransferase [Fusobacteriaceae bacterium]
MKILFMGTPEFALQSLRALDATHDVAAVFTKTDKPNTRGGKIKYGPVKIYSQERGIPVFQPEKLRDPELLSKVRELQPDLIAVVAYGKLIPPELFKIPPLGTINVHSSLLPKLRGAAPIHGALVTGESETGVSIMYIAEGLDTGDIILQEKIPIEESDNYASLHDKLAVLGAETLIRAVSLLEKGEAKPRKQDETRATYIKSFGREDLRVDWNKGEREIFNFVRGMDPQPGAFAATNGKILKIARVLMSGRRYDHGLPGEVVEILKKQGPVVKCGDGAVIISAAGPENKKKMTG